MAKNEMPAAEASERARYELAFHVLPTVAEGEVPTVFENLKAALTKAGAEITDEEAPARFDLAYEIEKYLEGRNRKFSSAYFGWVRFTDEPANLTEITTVVEQTKELLRHLVIKLTKVEEANPFYFHEALTEKQIETVGDDEAEVAEKPEAADEAEEKEADTDSQPEESDDDGADAK